MTAEQTQPLADWELALLGDPDAQARQAYWWRRSHEREGLLDRIDAAVESRCAGPGCGQILTERSASAYWCSPGCQEAWNRQRTDRPEQVRGSTEVAPGPARWRPDLVDDFDDTDLELLDRHCRADTGLNYSVYTRRSNAALAHLRVDDGHRFVGLDVEWAQPWASGPSEAFRRLERELADPRRVGSEPVPETWSDPLRQMGVFGEGMQPPAGLAPLGADQLRAVVCEWLRANWIDPDEVPEDAQIEVRDGLIYCEVVQQGAPGAPLHRRQVVVRHRCRPPWPGTGPCPNCVDRCEPGCGCTCWEVPPEPANSWSHVLRRMGEAFDREVLGSEAGRSSGLAERVEAFAAAQAACTVFWTADPPADPEAPTPAELTGGAPVGQVLHVNLLTEDQRQDAEHASEHIAEGSAYARSPSGTQTWGAPARIVTLPPATQQAIQAAAEAEQDRLTLRAVCADEAEYERALRAAQDHGLTVREVAEMLAAGQAIAGGVDDRAA